MRVAAEELSLSQAVEQVRERLIAVRRDLHQHPEGGFKEVRTAGIVADRLKELGYKVQTGVAQTGVVGLGGSARRPETLLLRFDMDALPIMEATEAPYASLNPGWMHACGHDGHTSIGLATAEILAGMDIPGQVKFIFQPAEEGPGGARPMINEGVLENPEVNACLGLHLWNELPRGLVGVRSGAVMASVGIFEVTIQGRGGHGAAPHQTCDATVIAAHTVVALQTIVSRNVDPAAPAVVSVGEIHAGSAHNVIADQARLRGTVRAFDSTLLERLLTRVEEVSQGVAATFGATVEVELTRGYPAVINDTAITAIVRDAAIEAVGPDRVIAQHLWLAGEDMGIFLQERPGCFFFVGSAREGAFPHHNPHFDIDEDSLPIATEVMVRAVERYFASVSGVQNHAARPER
jgi:amidohydrolase